MPKRTFRRKAEVCSGCDVKLVGPYRLLSFQRPPKDSATKDSPELVESGMGGEGGGGGAHHDAGLGVLGRQLCFCAGGCAVSFAGAAIWQYEGMRRESKEAWKRQRRRIEERMREFRESPVFRGGGVHEDGRRKALDWRRRLNRLWNEELSEGQRVFAPICAANVAVFLAWRLPGLRPFMLRWFACNPASRSPCVPMLASAFSHHSGLHLAVNMFVLHSFANPVVQALGKEQFVGFYLASALFSSFFASVYKARGSSRIMIMHFSSF